MLQLVKFEFSLILSSLNLKVKKTFVNHIYVYVIIFTGLQCEMLGFSYVSIVSVVVSRAKLSTFKTILQCLTGALRNDNPKLLMAASALLLPLRPFTVSALHTGMMEVTF